MTVTKHILKVSELTKKVRFILESELNVVWLSGEISNFMAAGSGHWYLSLKDEKSQVKCAMFKGNNRYCRIKPSNGDQVLVKARVSLYEPRGDFQLIIEQMEDAGEGLLQQQYEILKQKLTAEGLFSLANKQTITTSNQAIQTVGIVTSPTGAAVKDIISVLNRRSPNTNVIIYPALVQGSQAADDIVASINIANDRAECDVLIVGRGGGSLEDLWCFNDEKVVRAIYQSKLAVISAVGHEIDTTLADYVADLRAPTPSAAAEIVSTDKQELIDKIQQTEQRLQSALQKELAIVKQTSIHLNTRLAQCHPQQQIEQQNQRLDELNSRFSLAISSVMQRKAEKPNQLSIALTHLSPLKDITHAQARTRDLQTRLSQAVEQTLSTNQQKFVSTIEQLSIVSPLATIARGYSVVKNEKNNFVKSVEQVSVGDHLSIQVSDGVIKSKVV